MDGKRFFHSHGLRSFFASVLYKSGLPQLTIDFFLGYQIDKVTEAYFKADIKSLKSEYLKVLSEITFIEEVETRIVTDEWRAKMEEKHEKDKKEMEWLKREIEHLKRHAKDREELD